MHFTSGTSSCCWANKKMVKIINLQVKCKKRDDRIGHTLFRTGIKTKT